MDKNVKPGEKEYHLARWVLSAVIPAQEQGEDSKAYELKINAEVSNPGTRNGYENLDETEAPDAHIHVDQ